MPKITITLHEQEVTALDRLVAELGTSRQDAVRRLLGALDRAQSESDSEIARLRREIAIESENACEPPGRRPDIGRTIHFIRLDVEESAATASPAR